eukprot:gene37703-45324_t
MLFLLGELRDRFIAFNLFQYTTFRTGGAILTGLLFVLLFGPAMINTLRIKQGKGQPIREDGPKSHLLTKKGTPTMGGLMILAGTIASTLLWARLAWPVGGYVWTALFVTVGFGAIGFYDDYLKVTKQSHKGFSGKARLACEGLIAIIACFVMVQINQTFVSMHVASAPIATHLAIPFFKDFLPDLGWFFLAFGMFVIVASGNAVNLTDGLDGLAIVPSMIAAGTFAIIAYAAGNLIFPSYLGINY